MAIEAFDVDEVIGRLAAGRHDFAEFFRAERMSMTAAAWPAGAIDDQSPHAEDEIYLVVRGAARLRVGEEETPVGPGSIAYVPALVVHRFVDITSDLAVVVVWSPPRGSRPSVTDISRRTAPRSP